MIAHAQRCIFVHVPKVAGQSIESVFLDLNGLSWKKTERAALLLRKAEGPHEGPPRLAHLTAAEYVTHGHVSQETFDAYYSFAFVRNPWDRLVSEYAYRHAPKGLSFRAFVLEHFPRPAWTDEHRHVLPQSDFVYGPDGRLLVDFVGRFETLNEDFQHVLKALGLPPAPLPHRNASEPASGGLAERLARLLPGRRPAPRPEKRPYPEYYDAETRAFVEDYYAADLAHFGYTFGG